MIGRPRRRDLARVNVAVGRAGDGVATRELRHLGRLAVERIGIDLDTDIGRVHFGEDDRHGEREAVPLQVHRRRSDPQAGPSRRDTARPRRHVPGSGRLARGAPPQRIRRRDVRLGQIVPHHAGTAEPRRQHGHAPPQPRDPPARKPAVVAIVEFGHDVALEQRIQVLRVRRILRVRMRRRFAANRPAHIRRVRLLPPAVERRQIEAAVHEDFHAARAGGFERAARRVHPHVHAFDQLWASVMS